MELRLARLFSLYPLEGFSGKRLTGMLLCAGLLLASTSAQADPAYHTRRKLPARSWHEAPNTSTSRRVTPAISQPARSIPMQQAVQASDQPTNADVPVSYSPVPSRDDQATEAVQPQPNGLDWPDNDPAFIEPAYMGPTGQPQKPVEGPAKTPHNTTRQTSAEPIENHSRQTHTKPLIVFPEQYQPVPSMPLAPDQPIHQQPSESSLHPDSTSMFKPKTNSNAQPDLQHTPDPSATMMGESSPSTGLNTSQDEHKRVLPAKISVTEKAKPAKEATTANKSARTTVASIEHEKPATIHGEKKHAKPMVHFPQLLKTGDSHWIMPTLDPDKYIYPVGYKPYIHPVSPRKISEHELALRHFNRGTRFGQQQDISQAIVEYQRALHNNPMLADAYVGLSSAYIYRNNWEEVINNAEEALKLKKGFVDPANITQARYNLSMGYCVANSYRSAKHYYKQVKKLSPDRSDQLWYFIENHCKP